MARIEQPVDIEHLNRYTGGDCVLNEEILQLFATQCREMMAKLESLAAGEADAKSWRETIHTLKGAARGIGAFAPECRRRGRKGRQRETGCTSRAGAAEKHIRRGLSFHRANFGDPR